MIRNVFRRATIGPYYHGSSAGALCVERIKLRGSALPGSRRQFPPPGLRGARVWLSTTSIVDSDDTIYAISTATGKAAIAVIRISGSRSLQLYEALCPGRPSPKPRTAIVRTLRDPSNLRNIIDPAALVLYFPAPNTATGEDILELHIHGGPATQKAVAHSIAQYATQSQAPIRYAEPGEFTRRAFQNDKLDLGQVEALSDALSAETEQQRRAAVRGHSRKLGQTYEAWREKLLYARGELEALIDFSEDQHFDESPAELLSNVTRQVEDMLSAISRHEASSQRGELLKRGIRISLLGPPNAGKSSLLNQLVGREASIVSQEAGTTRDIVEVSLDIRGYLCTFADTAGLRGGSCDSVEGIGVVEREGIRRAKAKARDSDVIIAMSSIERSDSGWRIRYEPESLRIASDAAHALVVINKCDSAPRAVVLSLIKDFEADVMRSLPPMQINDMSCHEANDPTTTAPDPGNVNRLIERLVDQFQAMTDVPAEYEDLIGVTERQRQLLSACGQSLLAFKQEAQLKANGQEADIVIAAEHLRAAAAYLSRITGRGDSGDVEEVLGVVFEKFCVGK